MTYPKWWLFFGSSVVLCVIVAGVFFSSISGNSAKAADNTVPFTQFIQSVNNAKYSDYQHLATTKVQNEQEFGKMRQHILDLYTGLQVDSTYMTDGQVIDCVVTSSQHGYTPGPITLPTPKTQGSIGHASSTSPSSCKQGTIPMQRVTLDTVVQFATLRDFLSQGKSGPPSKGK